MCDNCLNNPPFEIPLNELNSNSISVAYDTSNGKYNLLVQPKTGANTNCCTIEPVTVEKNDNDKDENKSKFSLKISGDKLQINRPDTSLGKSREYTYALLKSNLASFEMNLLNLSGPSNAVKLAIIGEEDYRARGPESIVPINNGLYSFEFEKRTFEDKVIVSGQEVDAEVTIHIIRVYGPS